MISTLCLYGQIDFLYQVIYVYILIYKLLETKISDFNSRQSRFLNVLVPAKTSINHGKTVRTRDQLIHVYNEIYLFPLSCNCMINIKFTGRVYHKSKLLVHGHC